MYVIKNTTFFILLLGCCFITQSFESRAYNGVAIDKEFIDFWKSFQQAIKIGDKNVISEFINFETYNLSKEEFLKHFNKKQPITDIKQKRILKTKLSEIKFSKNGEYAFDPWIDKADEERWNEVNILTYLPVGSKLVVIEYPAEGTYAGTTLVFAKKEGVYKLFELRFMTYD
ncbi:MAG: hypothetical protein ACM3U1_00830 [Chloroflexota bacterium]